MKLRLPLLIGGIALGLLLIGAAVSWAADNLQVGATIRFQTIPADGKVPQCYYSPSDPQSPQKQADLDYWNAHVAGRSAKVLTCREGYLQVELGNGRQLWFFKEPVTKAGLPQISAVYVSDPAATAASSGPAPAGKELWRTVYNDFCECGDIQLLTNETGSATAILAAEPKVVRDVLIRLFTAMEFPITDSTDQGGFLIVKTDWKTKGTSVFQDWVFGHRDYKIRWTANIVEESAGHARVTLKPYGEETQQGLFNSGTRPVNDWPASMKDMYNQMFTAVMTKIKSPERVTEVMESMK